MINVYILLFLINTSFGISLNDLVCRRQPRYCQNNESITIDVNEKRIDSSTAVNNKKYLQETGLDLPKKPTNFDDWKNYGVTSDDGTGYGSGIGPGYGPGLGDIIVKTGVGIQHPFGNIGIRRDFELGFGGSGRIGGVPVGFGNGYSANGLGMSQSGWPHSRPFTNGDTWPLG